MAGYELGKLSDNVARFSQPLASLALELNIGNLFQTIPKHRYHKQKRRVNRFFDIRKMLASPRSAAINVELVEINDSIKPAQNSLVMGHDNQCLISCLGLLEDQIKNQTFVFRVQVASGFIG